MTNEHKMPLKTGPDDVKSVGESHRSVMQSSKSEMKEDEHDKALKTKKSLDKERRKQFRAKMDTFINKFLKYGGMDITKPKSRVDARDLDVPMDGIPMSSEELYEICYRARECIMMERAFIQVDAPCVVVGDIHGQFDDLLHIFARMGLPSEGKCYVFLGDYVDRGPYSIECATLLLALKLRFHRHIYLLRGNHETRVINRVYGFYDECKSRYTVDMWTAFQDVFNTMPFCARISSRIFCMHGGLSQEFYSWKQLDEENIRRPCDVPEHGVLTDLLWADPDPGITGFVESPRGTSQVFGVDIVKRFCAEFDVDLVCRAHQVVNDGYEFFADRRLVTIFSAPYYCGQFENPAAVMKVDRQLCCSFVVWKPAIPSQSITVKTCGLVSNDQEDR